MKQVNREYKDKLLAECVDCISRDNNGNLRSRYCFFMSDSSFVCVENNTEGYFRNEAVEFFSSAIFWVMAA